MAVIRAFRGIRYNAAVVGELQQVATPPYDVIGAKLQDELYRRSPYNMVRLDLGKVYGSDHPGADRYTRSRALLAEWLREGVLQQDAVPTLYWLEEEYLREDGSVCVRKGFVAAVRIEDANSGMYRPHEKTLAKPKEDRIQLTRACRTNLSSIFSLYDDPTMTVSSGLERAATRGQPAVRVRDEEGVETRMWCIADLAVAAEVAAGMVGKSFFIADGHHRYETALAHRDWMRQQVSLCRGDEPWNYVMMYLSNMRDPGLTVFPTHRVVFGLENFDVGDFLERAKAYFQVAPAADAESLLAAVAAPTEHGSRFGVCAKGQPGGWVLTLAAPLGAGRWLEPETPTELHDLDVTILHTLILNRLLHIDEQAQEEQRNLRYIKGRHALLEAVAEDRELQLGFVLNATRIDQVKRVAEAGQRMPQKSTFFYPKLVTGLVLHALVGDVAVLQTP